MRVVPRAALIVLLAACGDPAARVQLAPVSPCGQVTNETALRVVGYTAGGELRRSVPPDQIDAFPADTEQLGVEVIGASGRIVAAGKTGPLVFDTLEHGTQIPIVMAPLDGVCPVGPLTEPRQSPLVARAGDLVLVVGGTGPGGEQLASAEIYDPATTTFSPVSIPASLMDPDNGLAGAVLTEMPDGRVALTGTANHALTMFDPLTRAFSTPSLFDHRAFHGAFAVGGNQLLVIGGCADVVGGACSGPSLRTGFIYDVTDLTTRERGPTLEPTAVRHGARVFDLGVQRDFVRRFVLAGGFGDATTGDRFVLREMMAETLYDLHAEPALLDGGALLTLDNGGASILSIEGINTSPVPNIPSSTASLVTLEDGSVVAVGNDIRRFSPTTQTWTALDVQLPLSAKPSVIRLADGTVLILGGDAGAWIFRPSLVGPTTGSLVIVPDDANGGVLTPSNFALASPTNSGLELTSIADDLRARVLVGGPRMAQGSITAVVRATAGGVALIAQQTGQGDMLVGRLVPGEPARIAEYGDTSLCVGTAVTDAELTQPVTFAISGGVATLSVGPAGSATVKATCEVPTAQRGSWGIAAAGADARVEVGPVTVARSR